MKKQQVLEKIREAGIVPVIRAGSVESALEISEAILDGGISCLEITLTIPGALRVIRELNEKFGEKILIGAGTVLDAEAARNCLEAGANFIVTPYLNVETIGFCNRFELAICAGALTPTEIFTAWKAGADCVKVFPASAVGGAGYLKSIRAPFPDINLMPTGGINLENINEYVAAGAFAVGVGGELADAKILASKGKSHIRHLAQLYREKILSLTGENSEKN